MTIIEDQLMSFDSFKNAVEIGTYDDQPGEGQTIGQYAMHLLEHVHPGLHADIASDPYLDPAVYENVLPAFFGHCNRHWLPVTDEIMANHPSNPEWKPKS